MNSLRTASLFPLPWFIPSRETGGRARACSAHTLRPCVTLFLLDSGRINLPIDVHQRSPVRLFFLRHINIFPPFLSRKKIMDLVLMIM